MKKKTLIPGTLLVTSLLATSVANAASIAYQNFDNPADFDSGGGSKKHDLIPVDGLRDGFISYEGTSGSLGFNAYGREKSGFRFGIDSEELVLNHGTSGSAAVKAFDAAKKYSANVTNQSDTYGILFNTVTTLGDYNEKSLTMNLYDFSSENNATGGNEEDLIVRLYLNGSSTGIDIFSTVANNTSKLVDDGFLLTGASFDTASNLLTYSFDDSVTTAELYVVMASDDDNHGYKLDNISFTGTTAVPEPSSAALLGLGGLALILRRRR